MKRKFKLVIATIKRLHSNPYVEWNSLKAGAANAAWHMHKFVYPVCLAVAVATFAGYLLASAIYNYSILFVTLKAIAVFCESYFTLLVSYLIIKELPEKYKPLTDNRNLFILMVYSFSTFWSASFIAGILANYKNLGTFLKFTGFYGILLLWIGTDILLNIPPERKTNFILIVVAICVIVYCLIHWSFGFLLTAAHFPGLLN